MTLDDIGIKQDNPDKVQFIQDNNVPANEYISMDEFNVVVAELKNLKAQQSREFKTEQFNVTTGDITNNLASFDIQRQPVENSLLVFVRGVVLAPTDVNVNGQTVNIVLQNVAYGVEAGDLVVIHYQSK